MQRVKIVGTLGPASEDPRVFQEMIAAGLDVRGVFHDGHWNDLGTLDRYLETHVALLRDGYPDPPAAARVWGDGGRRGSALAFGLRADGRPWGDRDAVALDPGATLHAPVALGTGARVEPGAVLGPAAVVGAGASIGAGATLAGSVVWPGAHVSPGAGLRDSVVFRDGDQDRVITSR